MMKEHNKNYGTCKLKFPDKKYNMTKNTLLQ